MCVSVRNLKHKFWYAYLRTVSWLQRSWMHPLVLNRVQHLHLHLIFILLKHCLPSVHQIVCSLHCEHYRTMTSVSLKMMKRTTSTHSLPRDSARSHTLNWERYTPITWWRGGDIQGPVPSPLLSSLPVPAPASCRSVRECDLKHSCPESMNRLTVSYFTLRLHPWDSADCAKGTCKTLCRN